MYQIVANKCKRRMREYYRQGEELTDELVVGERSPKDCWNSDRLEQMQVREAFFRLPEEDRQIVGLHVFFGYKTREIAQILEMNENTVRSRESRALKRLESQLGNGNT